MNKVSLLVFSGLLATVASAASVDWDVPNATESQVGYIAFLVTSIDSSWGSVADIRSSAIGFGGQNAEGKVAKLGRDGYGVHYSTVSGEKVTDAALSKAYIVIVSGEDAETYNYKGYDFSKKVYEPPKQSPGLASGDVADIIEKGQQGTFSQTDPTPEPTSGLLLLLGAAGLALRRRVK